MTRSNKYKLCYQTIVLICCVSFCFGDLKPLDPSRAMYQKKEGFPSKVITWPILGGVELRRLPDPVTIAELEKQLKMQEMRHNQAMKQQEDEHKDREHSAGSWAIIIGWGLIALGAAAHWATSIPLLKSLSSSIITLGAFAVAGGFGLQMTVEYDYILKCAVSVVGLVYIIFKLYQKRDFHLPDKIKRKLKPGTQAET